MANVNDDANAELIARYRLAAIGSDDRNPDKANWWHAEVLRCYRRLKQSAQGRQAILDLMTDPNPHIRCWAATHSLQWAPEAAKKNLEAIKESEGPCSFEAQMVLDCFNDGTLEFE